jgi:photosystem II stability/assembly factor-like uncharacterized protein
MKGDFTRSTFRPERHFSGVRLQQGRVQLDADFNEQVDIAAHRDRTTAADLIGGCGTRDTAGGFSLFPTVRLNGLGAAGNNVWAVGQRAAILTSNDGGLTWSTQNAPSGVTGDLHAVEAVGANTAVAVGTGARLIRTTNGGTTWTTQSLPNGVTADLRAVSFGTSTRGCAVGDDGLILLTSDGASWTRKVVSGHTGPLFAIDFVGANHAWAVGTSGRILSTTDAGANWQVQDVPTGTHATLRAVHFANTSIGWAVGDGGTILSTKDGGATWTRRDAPLDVTRPLRSLHGHSPTAVWAVGDDSIVIRSQDGGDSWEQIAPVGLDLTGVLARDDRILVCGDLATIAHTDAATGPSWTSALIPDQLPPADLGISAGRMYVDGVLCEIEKPLRFLAQPDLPGATLPSTAGRYLAYLDVWERHVTAAEQANLREIALGGPDTATRTQVMTQVRLEAVADDATCSTFEAGWSPSAAPKGRLRARGEPSADPGGECVVPMEGGYRRLENQLYRVEVIDAGQPGTATFVWSRDNGAVTTQLVRVEAAGTGTSRLILSHAGRDAIGGLAGGRYVEITDEQRVLGGAPAGRVFEVESVADDTITIKHTPSSGAALDEFSAGDTVRRWDGYQTVEANGWLPLEDGVEVQLSDGNYATGDHWMIPARTTTATVEWPTDEGEPRFELPHGIEHAYCPLTLLALDESGGWSVSEDCRHRFPPLTEVSHLFYVSGDGQEVMPEVDAETVTLPRDLQVGVANRPGAIVRFEIVQDGEETGKAALSSGEQSAARIEVPTDDDGIASCTWRLGSTLHPQRRVQQVEAVLLDGAGAPLPLPVRFTARLSLASQVAYDPGPCDFLEEAQAHNVQDAITELCSAIGRRPVASLRLDLRRQTLRNVDDAVGRWQYDGGEVLRDGNHVADYAGTKRVTNAATTAQNTAMLTITIFFKGKTPPENLTLQGAHHFGTGGQVGSVSAASPEYLHFIGQPFRTSGNTIFIGAIDSAPFEEILLEPRHASPGEPVRLVVALAAPTEERLTIRLGSTIDVPGLPEEVTVEPGMDRAELEFRAPPAGIVPPEGMRIVITGRGGEQLRRRTLVVGGP